MLSLGVYNKYWSIIEVSLECIAEVYCSENSLLAMKKSCIAAVEEAELFLCLVDFKCWSTHSF